MRRGRYREAVRAALPYPPGRKTGAARAKAADETGAVGGGNGPSASSSPQRRKPIRDSKAIDAVTAVDALEYFAGMATKIQGDTIPVPGPYINMTLREPLGVIGGIIPWNYPLLQAVWKIAGAGNRWYAGGVACLSVMFSRRKPAGIRRASSISCRLRLVAAALVDHHMVAR
jgi:hypothetical protein